VLWAGAGCTSPSSPEGLAGEAVYEIRETLDPDGTGRFYLGREIARILEEEHSTSWLERPGRETTELPSRVVQALKLRPTDIVADIGAGTGYFTFRLSERVPYGRVYAVDIVPEMLDVIRIRIGEEGVKNIESVLGTLTSPNLPAASVDVALIVSSYHEFSHPYEMMSGIVSALKPGGRVVLVEYRGEDATIPVPALHRMTEAQARREMQAVGLVWRETRDNLPQQHLLVFEKPFLDL